MPPAPGTSLASIAVLFSPSRVPARRLQMAIRVRTNPHVSPDRRNRERSDAHQGLTVTHGPAVGMYIGENFSPPLSGDTGPAVVHIPHTANPQTWQPVCPRRQFGFAVSPSLSTFPIPSYAALGPDFRPRAFAGRAALPALPLVSTLRFKSAIKSMTSPLAGRSSPSSEGSVITSVCPA
jgi:hypothetical protein